MNPANVTVAGGKIKKKKSAKRKKYRIIKFKKEKFLWAWGAGLVFSVLGLLIIRDTMSASEDFQGSGGYSAVRNLIAFPESPQDIMVFIFGNLLLLFGVVCIFIGLKIAVKYISRKLKN